MSDSLDGQIFDEFLKLVMDKKILSGDRIDELKALMNKPNVSAEDWDLLADKECFPRESEGNAKQN
ncbi:MAG: hypothetical protein KKC39_04320 [Candidatus Omnitrophica bacterium]|jgi:hypothetical protein|nr:hypothetical protein [Candidatus Omnitrophota bacterium]MBU4467947.1 hypothetical protein [Candidatus Omnitrophota bacterium]MCG2708600.1 hypothetical protein [Candidatus Omnitrophota bacterium]